MSRIVGRRVAKWVECWWRETSRKSVRVSGDKEVLVSKEKKRGDG